jgi:5'(3')-deoxyribonucleotidase
VSSPFVLGVDLDGVCADYTSAFRTAVARHRGLDESTLPDEVTWDFAEWGLDRESFLAHHRRAVVEDHLFATMPPIDGVSDTLWRLSDAGVWIRVITHRLVSNWNHATAVADTVAWLDDRRIPYRDICFLGAKPQVGADLYVEDAPHNVEALRASGARVVVFDQPYNRHLGGLRARTWTEVEDLVVQAVVDSGRPFPSPLPLAGLAGAGDRLGGESGDPADALASSSTEEAREQR